MSFAFLQNIPDFPSLLPKSISLDNCGVDDDLPLVPAMTKEWFCREDSYYLVKIYKSKMHKNEELMLCSVKEYMRKVTFGDDGVGIF